MLNFDEFRKDLTDLCTYYQIPINSLVVAGQNANELNILYSSTNENICNENKKFTHTVALFATQSTFDILKLHFTTSVKQRSIITFIVNDTKYVVFQQSNPLDIKVFNSVKFLNKKALKEFRYGVPEKYKHY